MIETATYIGLVDFSKLMNRTGARFLKTLMTNLRP